MADRIVEALKLTEKQAAPVRQILETSQQDMGQWMRDNGPALRELQTKLRGGRTRRGEGEKPAEPAAGSAERKEAAEKYQAIMKQRTEKAENALKQLDEHLTEEQMVIARRYLTGRSPSTGARMSFGALRELGLSEQQQTKVREIMQGAREGGGDKEPAARAQAYRDAWDKVVKEVLTPEQQGKLKEVQQRGPEAGRTTRGATGGMYAGLDLSDKQQQQISEIMAGVRKRMEGTEGRDARREAYMAAQQEIRKVLTPEQIEKLDKRREEMRQRGGQRGGQRTNRKRRETKDNTVIVD